MWNRCCVLLVLFSAVIWPLGGTAAAKGPLGAQFTTARCPFRAPKGIPITCGYLTVPEDRGDPNSAQIRLAVAIARTARDPKAADPIVYLAGGPGSPAVASAPLVARAWSAFLRHRDLIVVDQRGTGHSRPALICPEHTNAMGELSKAQDAQATRAQAEYDALMQCRERLTASGVRLSAYTTAASAADLRELRLALGYPHWNLLGVSYGTRLALEILRQDPDGIRSAILDSPYPPQVNLFTSMPANLDRALRTLFTGCSAAPACQQAYPHLETTFYNLVSALDAHPITIRVRDPHGRFVRMRIDGGRLIEVVFRMLYVTDMLPNLPRMIAATAVGSYGPLAEMESLRLRRAHGHSAAMYFSVQCSEDMALTNLDQVQAAVAAYPQLRSYFAGMLEFTPNGVALCSAWGVVPPDPRIAEPVQSHVPVLILSGEYDPITPPDWAQIAAATLSSSETYLFPGTGHAVIGRSCARQMIQAFLEGLSAAPSDACHESLPAPSFHVP